MNNTAPLLCIAMISGSQFMPTVQNQSIQGSNIMSIISYSNSLDAQTINFKSESNSKLEEEKNTMYNCQSNVDNSTFQVAYYINGDKMNSMMLNEIPYDDKTLVFKDKYLINYDIEEGYYTMSDSELGISCYGISYEELCEDIKDNISANWEMYVDCDENELSEDAIELRNKLLSRLELKS